MAEHKECLICNSNNLKSLSGYENAFLCICKKCGFTFSQKIPSVEELSNFYNGYGQYEYVSPITISRYNELIDQFESYRETNNILDIGSGTGVFLEEAKKKGWNVYGTEYGDDKVKIGEDKGINMEVGVFDPKNYQVKFDVITSFEVIEHINNPQEEIRNISSLLRTGGMFYLTTPNFNSLSRRFLKEKWQQIFYPEHLSYYTAKTLSNLLKINSLKPINTKTTGISLTVYKKSKGADISLGNSEDSDDELMRQKMETNKLFGFIKVLLNGVLSLFKIGDTIKIFSIKK